MSALTVEEVLGWRPETLRSAARDWRLAERACAGQVAALCDIARSTEAHWIGSAGTAARAQLVLESDQGNGLSEAIRLAAAALSASAGSLEDARQLVRLLVDQAHAHRLLVDAVGDVRVPSVHQELPARIPAGAEQDRLQELADTLSVRLRSALQDALAADRAAAARLSRITLPDLLDADATRIAGDSLVGSDLGRVLPAAVPWALGAMSPTQAGAWWRGLSPAEQQLMIQACGSRLGNLDGIPAWVRDQVNRAQLPVIRTQLERERTAALAAFHPSAYAGNGAPLDTPPAIVDELSDKLRALDAIERVLARGDRQLVLLDAHSGHQMHAAVAIGNLDTAANVAVFTPGFTSTVQHSLSGYDRDLAALKKRADQQSGRGTETAAVSWLGYDAPQVDGLLSGPRSVASTHLAKSGGARLASYFRGLNAARTDAFHLVALGHSYGGATTGFALKHSHLGVDAAIFLGAPGAGARHSSELHARQLYDLASANDPVPLIDRFGRLPQQLPGIERLSTHALPGRHLRETSGHGGYLAPGTTSQWNLAAAVVGDPAAMIRAPAGEQPGLLSGFRTLAPSLRSVWPVLR